MVKKKLCVVGAGLAGLCAIKHGIEHNCEVIAFEQNNQIGGLWIYDDNIGKNEYGIERHSSLYKNLQTNLPKEVMGYPDFPFPEQEKSFIAAKDVLDFLKLYADTFNLRNYIKSEHLVIRVRPLLDDGWEVIVKNLPKNYYETFYFDLILVCNGHYSTPFIPRLTNMEIFKGTQVHSHDYKMPEPFKDEKVLVVGSGPSGIDIAHEISSVATHVFISNRDKEISTQFPDNVTLKPEVLKFSADGSIFVDGSEKKFTNIVYCTGYKFTFPFLSADCEVATDQNYIRPLFKHCISINRPSMGIIGLPFTILPSMMIDLQVRFCLKFMTEQKTLPSRNEMLEDTENEMNERWRKGYPKNKAHYMGPDQNQYYQDLAQIGGIEPLKPVITKLYKQTSRRFNSDVRHFREDVYRIIDDDNFIKIK